MRLFQLEKSTYVADYSREEVCHMRPEVYWALFCATGAPEYYLLYRELLEAESGTKSA